MFSPPTPTGFHYVVLAGHTVEPSAGARDYTLSTQEMGTEDREFKVVARPTMRSCPRQTDV